MHFRRWLLIIRLRLRSLFKRQRVEAELSEELQFHIERKLDEYLDKGMSPVEARRAALRAMNGLEQNKERCRDMRRVAFFENLLKDLRYGLRILIKTPGFTIVAVLTLALGIGANTAIFSIVNSVLLRPLPYREPDRLVKITFNRPGIGLKDVGYSVPELDDLKSRSDVFDDVTVCWPVNANLTGAKQPERLELLGASPSYFSVLGVTTPEIGRLFGPQDVTPGFAEAVVISDALWTRSFGRDPKILGKGVRLDGDLYTIVGVLPPDFRHPGPTVVNDVEVWTAAGFTADPFPKPDRRTRYLPGAIGRLKPGLSIKQAQAKLDAMSAELMHDYPNAYSDRAKLSIEIQPLQQALVGDVRPMLLVLMGAVILIIVIASVNIASLLLARASGRQREIAVRLALGASRARIIRQMLTESMLLSLIGGIAGIVTAWLALGLIIQLVPAKIPRLNEVSIDWRVLGFALLVSLFTGILFGLAPAIQSVKADVYAAVKEGAKGSGYGKKTGRVRDVLIVSELALAVVLMVGAGLLLRTFQTLLQQNPGFNPSRIVSAGIWLPVPNDPKVDRYGTPESLNGFVREVFRRVSSIPGVQMVGMASSLPATVPAFNTGLVVENRAVDSNQDLSAGLIFVSPDYFKLLQATLVQGRQFTEDDTTGKPLVAIIDESTARRYWPAQDPIGKRVKFGPSPAAPWLSVVGVVKDIKHDGLDKDGIPHLYTSIYQYQTKAMMLAVQTSLPVSELEKQFRNQIQSIDPSVPVFGVKSMSEVLDASLAPRRFSAQLVGAFAGLALLLSSIGIYGLLSYMVGQRTNEIGIRMALGAQPAAIRRLVLSKGTLLAGIGLLIGLVLSAIAAPTISSLLYGVHPVDPIVFVAVPFVLGLVALLSSYIPAYRATRVDPITALREG
ncbi:MAG TPA: ABC transporter permease [Blastocatellia bacterium]|nr:ABC transporter permease [Blastocatellia bacterium]